MPQIVKCKRCGTVLEEKGKIFLTDSAQWFFTCPNCKEMYSISAYMQSDHLVDHDCKDD